MLKKLFYLFSLLTVFSCNNYVEDTDSVYQAGDTSSEDGPGYVRLEDNSTQNAGMLTFKAKGTEATLKWIVADGINLDTTQAVVALNNGTGELPIRWHKKLEGGTYGPKDLAFKAGVMITSAGESQYFPLVWAYEVDSVKLAARTVQTRAAGMTPRASVVRFIPSEVAMNDESGATMIVTYTGASFVVLNYADFTKSMNVNTSSLPQLVGNDGSTYKELKFQWTDKNDLPVLPFSAKVLAMADDGYTANGTVTWGASSPSLDVIPLGHDLPAAGGNNIASSTVKTNQYRWTAVTNQGWLRIAPTTGSGHDIIYFSADANPNPSRRTAIVTVTAYNATNTAVLQRTIEVSQDKADPTTLKVSPDSHTVAASGATVYSNISSNAAWTAVSNAPWLTVNPTGGTGNGMVSLVVAANTTKTSRMAIVTVTAGSITQNVTITQRAAATVITNEEEWIEVNKGSGYGNGSYEVAI